MESPSFLYIQSGRRLWDSEEFQSLRCLPQIHLKKCLFTGSRLDFLYVLFFPRQQSLLVIKAQAHSPGFPSGLVVKNIILRQRAAVHVADGALGGGGSGSGILLTGGNRVDHRLRRRLRPHPATAAAIRLTVEVVQVLGDAEAGSVQQELGQEVTRCR